MGRGERGVLHVATDALRFVEGHALSTYDFFKIVLYFGFVLLFVLAKYPFCDDRRNRGTAS
jgi:hypothetical protein